MTLNILVVDLYSPEGRERSSAANLPAAGTLLRRVIKAWRPDTQVDVWPFDQSATRPPAPFASYQGILLSGSDLNIPRGGPLIAAQLLMCQNAFASGVPQFGCCYGLQLATAAAGGSVTAIPQGPEIAFARDIALHPGAGDTALFKGRASGFDALCWHFDHVARLPDGARLLAGNVHCAVQAAYIPYGPGRFWGVQYHPEFDLQMVEKLLNLYGQKLVDHGSIASIAALENLIAEVRTRRTEAIADLRTRSQEIGHWLLSLDVGKDVVTS